MGLSGAFFLKGVNEKLNAEKSLNALKADYAIQQGINHAIYELLTQNKIDNNPLHDNIPWATHTLFCTPAPGICAYPYLPDNPSGNNPAWPFPITSYYELTEQIQANTTPGLGAIDTTAGSPTYGCYVKQDADGNTIYAAKIYIDAASPTERVILVKGCSGNVCRLIVTKFSGESLYNYFIFTPYEFGFGWKIYDASGGKIHTNGDFIFYERATIKNFSSLSAFGFMRYEVNSYIPPGPCGQYCPGSPPGTTWEDIFWSWRKPYFPGKNLAGIDVLTGQWNDNENWYVNQSDGHLFGNSGSLFMEFPVGSGTYEEWDPDKFGCPPEGCPPLLPDALVGDPLYEQLYFTGAFPVFFDFDNWGPPHPRLPIPNVLYGYNGEASPRQWNIYNIVEDEPYSYPEVLQPKWFTNSDWFPQRWQDFIQNNPVQDLRGIVKESRSGGNYINPQRISSGMFKTAADQNGIYIYEEKIGGVTYQKVRINGDETRLTFVNGKIIIDGTVVMEEKTFQNTTTANEDTVYSIYMDKLMGVNSCQGGRCTPINGIIYSTFNTMVENASEIPERGLTFVTEQSLYLKGDFNKPQGQYVSQPAAGISAGYAYTLSADFNFPQSLPWTLHNPNFPDIDDSLCSGDPPDPRCDGWSFTNVPNEAKDTDYYISLVGYYGYQPQILERWARQGEFYKKRTIEGAFVRLPEGNFPGSFNPTNNEINKVRCCGNYPSPCRDCKPPNPNGYPIFFRWDMTTYPPSPGDNIYRYDQDYLNPNPRPPGDLLGFYQAVQLEINNTENNFSNHFYELN